LGELINLGDYRQKVESRKAEERAKNAAEVADLEAKLKSSLFTECIELDRDSLFRLYSLAPYSPVAMVGYALYAMSGADGTGRPDYHTAVSLLKRAARNSGFRKEAFMLLLDSAPDFVEGREMTKHDVGMLMDEVYGEFFNDQDILERLYFVALDTMGDAVTANMFCTRGLSLNPGRFMPYKIELDQAIQMASSDDDAGKP
jgi:hypothetical protein